MQNSNFSREKLQNAGVKSKIAWVFADIRIFKNRYQYQEKLALSISRYIIVIVYKPMTKTDRLVLLS